MLEKRVEILSNAGLRGELLSSTALRSMEPEVDVGEYGGAAYFPDDCQMDAMRTISFIEKVFLFHYLKRRKKKRLLTP